MTTHLAAQPDDDLALWLEASVDLVRAKKLRRKKMNEIVKHQEPATELSTWRAMREQAKELVQSGFLPKAVNTPEKAMAIIQTGKELGLGPMQSLRSIHIIDGKPTMGADLIGGLALSKVPGSVLRVVETTNAKCTVEAGRQGQKPTLFTFTIDDAKNAGLTGKQNWRNYPRAMLRARAITEACRAVFPDAVMGLYDPDELGAVTSPSGEVIAVTDITPHADSPDAAPAMVHRGELEHAMTQLEACHRDVNDPGCTWETMTKWRGLLGSKGKPAPFGQQLSDMYRGDLSKEERAALAKIWNSVDRKLTQLEGKLKPPPVEASYVDADDDGTDAFSPQEDQGDG